MEPKKLIAALAVKHRGDWELIYKDLHHRGAFDDPIEIERLLKQIRCNYITICDREYPDYLRNYPEPPFALFYSGDISLISDIEHNLAVIGTREPTIQGIENTRKIVRGLKENIVVVSGLARGIDGEAHHSALMSGHKTIAVLGSGIDICYPMENYKLYKRILRDKNNLVISEYPNGVAPSPDHFPKRNRLISAFSKRLLVTEARLRSGTTSTMSFALTTNKDVLCLPSIDFGNSACNLCIKDGGYLVESSEDVNVFFWR